MNELAYVTVGLYFEVKDSYIYGGEGSVGYAAINLEEVDTRKITDEFINKRMQELSEAFKVPVDSVKLISKEEYDRETEDDEFDTYTQDW